MYAYLLVIILPTIQHLSCQRLILIGEHFDVRGIQKWLTQACVQCDATLERDCCMKEWNGRGLHVAPAACCLQQRVADKLLHMPRWPGA